MPILPPTLGHTQRSSAELRVESAWIEFFGVAPGRVRIEVAVHNRGGAPSKPQLLNLDAAPIGAHLSWQHLSPLRLPAILPRRTLTVATEVFRAQPSHRSLPVQILRGAADRASRLDRIPNLGRLWNRACNETVTTELWACSLPLDPFELLGRKSPQWAGGIRVCIGSETTSSCCRAQALRFAPGKTNMVLLSVGKEPDEYAFEFKGKAAQWNPSLLVTSEDSTTKMHRQKATLLGTTAIVLTLDPPDDAQKGDLQVHVQRKSLRTTETIELDLDATAPGPGCFLG